MLTGVLATGGLLDPQRWIDAFGTWALAGIVVVLFVEVGLMFPLLPGDSLLFTAGALMASSSLHVNLSMTQLSLVLVAAAFAGTQTGYWLGRTLGPRIFARPDSRVFNHRHVDRTNEFFARYGGRTLVVAQFIPFVRTYASVAAGVGRMPYGHFVTFNAIGVVAWAGGVTWLGYALGGVPFVRDNIEVLLVLVVAVSVAPLAVQAWRKRRTDRREAV